MDTRLNIFTQTEQVEFIPVSLCHDQFIEYCHYFLSLARPNDVKRIIVQECHGINWNLQIFYSVGEDKVKWVLYQINSYSYESHSTFSSWSSPRYKSNKKKRNSEKHTEMFLEFFVFFSKQIREKQKRENYLHGKAPNKQKKNKEIFLDFLFSTTTKHAQKVNYYNYFFCFF